MPRRNFHRSVASGGRRHRAAALAAATGILLALTCIPAAHAAPTDDLASKRAKAAEIQAQLDAGNERAEMLTEQYLGAKHAVDEANAKIGEAEQGLAAAKSDADNTRAKLGDRAAFLYMGAGTRSPIDLNIADARELGARATYGDAAADQDNELLAKLRLDEERLQEQRDKFQTAKATADTRRKEAESTLQAAKDANAAQEATLASLNGEIKTLVDQAAAQKRATEDAAARAAAPPRPGSSGNSGGGTTGGGTSGGGGPSTPPPPSGSGAGAAVAYAYAQLGKPYVYAAAGPNAFDCSGLTMMAWRAGGVSMPHYSGAQAAMFPRVPKDQMQPGDLVLFYSDLHHVGIYVGGGNMINATHTGDFVRLQPIWRDTFQFAVRPG